jgi:uncharacterized protein YbjT (DUF2867 family)
MIDQRVLVFGATGNIGGAAAHELLARGWRVRAVTRNPNSEKAQALAALGAEVVVGDMDDRDSIAAAFDSIQRAFSVQNWTIDGVESEVRQGKIVADAAQAAGVKHLVYGSAGVDDPHTGVPHFNSKLEVEAHMRALGLPFTILRPGPFMELLTEKDFYPALGAWGAQIKVLGWDKPIPWVGVCDIGIAIANIFEDPERWIGQDVTLFGDVRTLRECRTIFESVMGKKPLGLPVPLPVFKKMAGEELVLMWKWLGSYVEERGTQELSQILNESRRLNPEMRNLESWLKAKHSEV